MGVKENGEGGFSYYNPDAVLLVLDSKSELHHAPSRWKMPTPWEHVGDGQVQIIEPLRGNICQSNCSALGAICMALDPNRVLKGCVCPDGTMLDFTHSRCHTG